LAASEADMAGIRDGGAGGAGAAAGAGAVWAKAEPAAKVNAAEASSAVIR
jgi:hypothetical protein